MEISTWTQRQIDLVDRWYDEFNCIGGFQAFTSFGKTSGLAIRAIKKVQPESLIISVPSIRLKQDWEQKLIENNLKGEVIVVNTAIRSNRTCDMLILDEAHRFVAETFSTIFEKICYNKLMWLTASPERTDGKEVLLFEKAPLVDNVTLEEGLEMGWVDPFEVIKIPIELTVDEKIELDKINIRYESLKKKLGYGSPLDNANFFIKYLDLRKWVIGKTTEKVTFVKTITNEVGEDKYYRLRDKHFNLATKEHEYYKKAVIAKQLFVAIADRKKLLYNAQNKLSKAVELIDQYKDQYKFVFSQRIEFLKELAKLLPKDEIRLYHSDMKKKDKSDSFDWFNDGRTKCRTLLSVKSLIEGIDIPKLSVGIFTSYTSSQIDAIQGVGRILRKYKNKRAVIIYLYVPGTQEEIWLNNLNI